MTQLEGAHVLVTGGAGTIGSTLVDQLLDAGVAHVDVLDNLVRGRRANLDDALATGRVELVDGDIRDAQARRRAHRRQGRRLPPGRDPHHPVRRGAAARARGARRRHVQRRRVGRAAPGAEARRGLERVGVRHGRGVPHRRASSPREQRHASTVRPRRSTRGSIRSFRAMQGLDYVLLRYFNVYGPRMDVHGLYTEVLVRWMERIADGKPPLIFGDGLQTMDFVCVPDIARANVLAAQSDVVEGTYNIASGTETSLLELARGAAARHGLRPRRRARSGARGQRRRPSARRHHRRDARPRIRRRRSASRTGSASSSTWWRAAARGDRGRPDGDAS